MKERLQREYNTCLSASSFRSIVVEERERTTDTKLVASLLAVFVTAEFADHCRTATEPYVCARLFEWQTSAQCPFPSYDDMARQNAGDGLDLLVFEWSVDTMLPLSKLHRVKCEVLDSFVVRHGGWRLRSLLCEACGTHLHQNLRNIGFQEWNRYDWWYEQNARLGPEARPILLGIDRDGSRASTDNTIMRLFMWEQPCCRFTVDQFPTIELMLEGMPDEEILAELVISSGQLRKRWSRIASEIRRHYPGAVPASGELRTQIRDFLHTHLFELRPFGSTKRPGPGRPPKSADRH